MMKRNSGRDKDFDAVRMMREIRDALTKETKGMSYSEQKRYIQKQMRTKAAREAEGESKPV